MNERIEELWIQSWTTEAPGYDYEKFAELIVKECAYIADKNSPLSYPDHGIKIKRHFGVEE